MGGGFLLGDFVLPFPRYGQFYALFFFFPFFLQFSAALLHVSHAVVLWCLCLRVVGVGGVGVWLGDANPHPTPRLVGRRGLPR